MKIKIIPALSLLFAVFVFGCFFSGCTVSAGDNSTDDDTVTDGATDGTSVTGSASSYMASDTTWDTLVWSDEFEGTSLKTVNWTYDTGAGGWGNSELETYTTGNAAVHGGVLDITADSSLNSARIKSSGLKTFKYGKIVARIKCSQGTGSWPAFWMLGTSSESWPYQGEIDIMEHVNSDAFTYQTCHWNSSGMDTGTTYSHASWGQTTNNNYWNDISSINVTEWHTYAIEWTSSIIEFYVDDTKVMAMNTGDSSTGTDTFNYPFYIIFNFAMGGQFPGIYSSSGFTNLPWHMYVDYVRVYQ
jgi:beta-glucanase (GH16 family)